jgi:hypothetical protein
LPIPLIDPKQWWRLTNFDVRDQHFEALKKIATMDLPEPSGSGRGIVYVGGDLPGFDRAVNLTGGLLRRGGTASPNGSGARAGSGRGRRLSGEGLLSGGHTFGSLGDSELALHAFFANFALVG